MPHIHTDPTIPAPDPDGDWLKISAALTRAVVPIAERTDLVVTCAPGAGRGSPGVHIPALATIEIDGGLLPTTVDPASVLATSGDRDRYPALWGVLTHEGAHAAHTRWTAPAAEARTPAAQAADLLEEARIEAAQIGRRRADRVWLRAASTEIILPQFTPTPDPAAPPTPTPTSTAPPTGPPVPAGSPALAGTVPPAGTAPPAPVPVPAVDITAAGAAQAAALLLARVDAGILFPTETAAVEKICTDILGADVLDKLRTIWRAALATADDDTDTMMRLGAAWADLVAEQPDQPLVMPGTRPGEPNPLAAAIADTVASVTANPNDPTLCQTLLAGTRPPTREERAAAGRLARALRRASVPERRPVTVTSPTPPGRLRMRGALAADAQRAAGALPTARPFTRTQRKKVPNPPLHLGIAVDVSASMRAFTGPAASTAWITATAAAAIPDTKTSTVIYGNHVRELTRPGRAPAKVTTFDSNDIFELFTEAVDLLTDTLTLDRPGGATRMLVIISDGKYKADQPATSAARLRRLADTGCHLLWIAPDADSTPIPPARALTLGSPGDTAQAIATAALRALTP